MQEGGVYPGFLGRFIVIADDGGGGMIQSKSISETLLKMGGLNPGDLDGFWFPVHSLVETKMKKVKKKSSNSSSPISTRRCFMRVPDGTKQSAFLGIWYWGSASVDQQIIDYLS